LEIPRDYYSASDMTLVLSDHEYNIPDQYRMWSMMSDVIQSGTGFTLQFEWISKNPNLDFSKDSWFKQSWTFQETVLSKKLVLMLMDLI
jgi:hypothetical protein